MQKIDFEQPVKLRDIPNIGKASEQDLLLIGITTPDQLKGQDPVAMYDKLCQFTGTRHDPCVLDVFAAAVHYIETAESLPWWKFT